MAEWDTAAICERIANAARLPRGSAYRTVGNLLPLVDQHLRTLVLPEMMKAGEQHLATTLEIPLVAGTATYRLPWRCVRVLGLFLRNAQGRTVRNFGRATPAQALQWHSTEEARRGTPRLWHLEASSLTVYPVPSTSDETLVLRYVRRPGRLVDSADVPTVTAVDGTSVVFSAAALGSPGAARLDFLKATPGFESLGDDVAGVIGPSGLTVELESAVTGLEVGDYVTLPGTAPVPQVPMDWLAVLESSVKEQLLRDGGDASGAAAEQAARLLMIQSASATMAPRSAEPEVIVNDSWL